MGDRPQHSKGKARPRRYHHGRSAGRQHDKSLRLFEREVERRHAETGETDAELLDEIAAWRSLSVANPSPLALDFGALDE